LLQQAGLEADALLPADIDETPQRFEFPRALATRLASEKAAAAIKIKKLQPQLDGAYLLAADTVVCVGRRILPKAETSEEAEECLRLLSGRQHRVYTAVSLITPRGAERSRLVEARLRFKRLSSAEIAAYIGTGEWRGKAGGYAIQGLAGVFLVKLVGSYSTVVGLPLYETMSLLAGEGYPVLEPWRERA
jgi:septum formation protein